MEAEQNSVETVEKVEAAEPQSTVTVSNPEPDTQEQINWKKFRQQREIERKQKDDAEKRAKLKEEEASALKAAMDAILSKPSTNSVQNSSNQYSEEEETEDQRIQKKVDAALTAREKSLEAQRLEKERTELPNKLVSTFKDFNQVCSSDNLDYLEFHYPEVASAFKHAPDSFDKWTSVYQAVKRFVPNTDSKKDQNKAEKNFNKPQSMAVSGVTQTSDGAPMILDDKRRSDNWTRMQKVMKGGR